MGDTGFGKYKEPTAQNPSWQDVKSEVLGVWELLQNPKPRNVGKSGKVAQQFQ